MPMKCIRSTPYRSVTGRVYPSICDSWRNYFCSVLLAVSLICIGLLDLIDWKHHVGVQHVAICEDTQNKTTVYLDEYKNNTKWYELRSVGPLSQNITLDLYDEANGRYDDGETQWPEPHKTSQAELLALSQGSCKRKVCWDSWGWRVICKRIDVPCTLSVDTEGLYFGGPGSNMNQSQIVNYTNIHHSMSSSMNTVLFDIWDRVNIVSSLYCYYMAAMIFIGAPYVITSRRVTTKCRFALSALSRPWFICCILLLWYSMEILQFIWTNFLVQLQLLQFMQLALKDPCFADSDFVTTMYSEAASICEDIEYSSNLYDASVSNLNYYQSVEGTYKNIYPQSDSDPIFVDDMLASQYNLAWDDQNATECSVSTMVDHIGLGADSSLNIWSIVLFSGVFAELLLQPLLANLTWTIFVMIDPLSPYCGRIEIPYQLKDEKQSDAESKQTFEDFKNEYYKKHLREIKRFERCKNWCPCCFWLIALILCFLNVASR